MTVVVFLFVPSVTASVFRTRSCTGYGYTDRIDSTLPPTPEVKRYFLRADE
eukprot:CAMPEP_0206176726 /NCGR_PEP_ID=MMETSP1474-20131121/59015_1 /ASSEMBLY_ACC=CAM_ASM_001110 /TAXON_ID=97495 /ORGANISM="Imantonia sp., Strain RCC918" /LENGTH=50 /DNA_ID=CAMNT_0053587979 /DNA_START=69 /DNA_END=218 /DNA_ORIENTATION=+